MTEIKSGSGRVSSFEYVAPDTRVEKFTPGPWFIDAGFESSRPGYFDEYWQVHDGSDAIACSANCYAGNKKANAHLIAAAPELYEALQSCLNFMENTECELGFNLDSADQARAALAKARGEKCPTN